MIKIDFNESVGKIKPMNGVNNGPTPPCVRGMSNFDLYKAANIPFARLHDSAFCTYYGWEFSVDVHRIFRNFDADETIPASYDFEETDKYLKTITDSGTEVFYRLGTNIEHDKKCGTIPPKDFNKWARICEHIIAHYVEGWASGFNYDIRYWEIWNEPDCGGPDGPNPCWQGTYPQFGEFFCIAAKHLKSRFPSLKIGGPAFAWILAKYEPTGVNPPVEQILSIMRDKGVKLDFMAYHCYHDTVEFFVEAADTAAAIFDKYGYGDCEIFLDEWNYVKGWTGDEWIYSMKTIQGKKGASFTAAVMFALQRKSNVDGLMYYDARPGTNMNGMFDQFFEPLPAYYAISSFGELLALGDCASSTDEKDIYVCAAKGENGKEILVTYYNDDDTSEPKSVDFGVKGADGEAEVYYLGDRGFELRETVNADKFTLKLNLFDVVKIKINRI